jgi:competence protein ComGC
LIPRIVVPFDHDLIRGLICMEIEKDISGREDYPLLELLLMVATTLIIAAIVVPSVIRAWQSANESSAGVNIQPVNIEQATHPVSAGGNSKTLSELVTEGALDSRFSSEPRPLLIVQYAVGYGPVSVHD